VDCTVDLPFSPDDVDPGTDLANAVVRELQGIYENGYGAWWGRAPVLSRTATSFLVNGLTGDSTLFVAGDSALVYLDAGRVQQLEGAGPMAIPVALSQASIDTVDVDFTPTDSTAVATADYTPGSFHLRFIPETTQLGVSVPVVDDAVDESDESFLLVPSNVVHAIARNRGEGVILNDDAGPNSPPSATLIAPNGGEHLLIGTNVNIQWLATDDHEVTDIDLYVQRNASLDDEPIALGLPNTGSYSWTVTGPVGNNTKIKVVAHDAEDAQGQDAGDKPSTVDDVVGVPQVPTAFGLESLGANPVQGEARFAMALPRASRVELAIVDVRGRRVATLAQGPFEAGVHSVSWDARTAAAGIYFVRFRADGFSARDRLVLLR